MKFALLGADPESLALADAAVAAGHEIVWQGDLAGAAAADHPWLETEDRGVHWEDLVDERLCDGILVGRGAADPTLRARQVHDLAKLGRHLLCVFPLVDSVLSYFEIDMARTDGIAHVGSFNPLLYHAQSSDLARWVREGHPQHGRVEQIQCIRTLADRSRARVVRRFARDVDFLQTLTGSINRIGAHGAAGDAESADAATYATLSVHMQSAKGLPIRWSVEPPEQRESLRVALLCARGRETVTFDAAERPPSEPRDVAQSHRHWPHGVYAAEAAAVDGFANVVGFASRDGVVDLRTISRWPEAVRAMELADSIEISLRRGRMIDVYQRELTEQLAFKGVMSAAGCGVLVVVIPLVLTVGWIAGAFKAPLSDYWPHVLLAILAAFLALQLLPKLLLRRADAAPAGGDASDERPTAPSSAQSAANSAD